MGNGIGAFLKRLEFVEREERAVSRVESSLFLHLLCFVKTEAAFAERPILPYAHPLEQELNGKEFVIRTRGISHPSNKVSRLAHARSVADLRAEAEGGK